MRTIKQLAQEALDVQDACNLSGVVGSFKAALSDLWGQPDCKGTDWVNRHPVSRLWADKIAHLTGTQNDTKPVTDAYVWAQDMVRGG